MGKWRNKGEDGSDGATGRPQLSEEQKGEMKKKKKAGGEPKATTANESKQAEPRQPTAPEKAMMGEDVSKKIYGQTMTSQDDKTALEAKYRDLQSGKITSKQFNEALYGSGMSQEDKLALDQSNYKGAAPAKGKKGKGGGKPKQVLPEGANPDEYYTGKWRTGKKPTPAPAPEPPKPPQIRTGPMPLEDAPPFPGYYPQPKFPERGPIGGGPGQFPYPMPMPQPSWPPRGGQQPWPFPPGSQPGFGGLPPSGPIWGGALGPMPPPQGDPRMLPPWMSEPLLQGPMPGWPPPAPPQGPPPQMNAWW